MPRREGPSFRKQFTGKGKEGASAVRRQLAPGSTGLTQAVARAPTAPTSHCSPELLPACPRCRTPARAGLVSY